MALGEILRTEREKQGYTLSQVAQNTNLLVQVVEALENEDFRRIAAAIYGRGFVRLYADFLGIDPIPLVQDFMALYDGAKPPVVKTRAKAVVTAPPTRPTAPGSVEAGAEKRVSPVQTRAAAVSSSRPFSQKPEPKPIEEPRPPIVRGRRVMPPEKSQEPPRERPVLPPSGAQAEIAKSAEIPTAPRPQADPEITRSTSRISPHSEAPEREPAGTESLFAERKPSVTLSAPEEISRPEKDEQPLSVSAESAPQGQTAPSVSIPQESKEREWRGTLQVPQYPASETEKQTSVPSDTLQAPAMPPPVPPIVNVRPQPHSNWDGVQERTPLTSVPPQENVPVVTGVQPLTFPEKEAEEPEPEVSFQIGDRSGQPIFSVPPVAEVKSEGQPLEDSSAESSATVQTEVRDSRDGQKEDEVRQADESPISYGDDRQPDLFDLEACQRRAAEEERARAARQRAEEEEDRKDEIRFADQLHELTKRIRSCFRSLPATLGTLYAHSRQILLATGALIAVLLLAFGVYTLFNYSERLMEAELPRPGDPCVPPRAMYVD